MYVNESNEGGYALNNRSFELSLALWKLLRHMIAQVSGDTSYQIIVQC